MKVYVGSDLHARSVSIAALAEDGKVIGQRRFASRPYELLKAIEPYRPQVSVAVEAVGSYYWFVDTLIEEGIEVHLANALMVKAIAYAKVKTDRADAETIAQLLRMGMLPEAYIYPKALRPVRDLSRRRERLVANRSLYYRHIQMMHQQMGMTAPARNVVKVLTAEELSSRFEARGAQVYLTSLRSLVDGYDTELKGIERFLHEECLKDSRYRIIRKLPGIDKIYGQMILLESGDVRRFLDHRHYSSYARVVGGSCDSAESRRKGRNPNQGNRYLRTAFRNAAALAVMKNTMMRDYFERKLKVVHKPAIAYSVIARKLAVAAYYILLKQEPADLERIFGTQRRRKQKGVRATRSHNRDTYSLR